VWLRLLAPHARIFVPVGSFLRFVPEGASDVEWLAAGLLATSILGRFAPQDAMESPLGVPESREASGTSWQPDSTPMHALHFMVDDWMVMAHGNVFVGFDDQTGRRGGHEWTSTNWAMLMARRPLGGGDLGLRTMVSLEPATVGRDGYPLLLQTGESLGGQPLHDTQHPHDLFMEVAAVYSRPFTDDVGLELYAAPAGEPAIGPTAFMHRFSASSDPLAPLGHHWMDSTHVSFGVVTAGLFTRRCKLEGSYFTGREPDENRWDFDFRRLDSWSGRFTVNPTENWSAQVSAARLRSPEALEPDTSVSRTTASVAYNRPWSSEGDWATTLAWGRNRPDLETATNAFLLESNLELDRHHVPFARAEYVRKSGRDLVLPAPLDADHFSVSSLSLGYLYNFDPVHSTVASVGVRFSVNFVDRDLEPFYGSRNPLGVMVFLRLWPAPLSHGMHDVHDHGASPR
jgi:hypothetical protein